MNTNSKIVSLSDWIKNMPDRDFDPAQGGFTLIMNELIDKLASFDLSGREHKVFWAIVRRTWSIKGQAWEEIRWKYFVEKTGITSDHVGHMITRLKQRKILQVKPGKRWQKYKINSKLSQWLTMAEVNKTTPEKGSATEKGSTPLPKMAVVPLPKKAVIPLKETILKETLLKKGSECGLPADFNLSLEREEYAVRQGIDINLVDEFFESFLLYVKSKGLECADWDAQFKIHCNNASRFSPQFMAKKRN